MKRLLCLLLTCLLVCGTIFTEPVVFSQAQTIIYGDGNNDKEINATDALITLKVAVGKAIVSKEIYLQLDVDGNDDLNAADALLILKFAVKKITSFPVEKESPTPTPPPEPDDPTTMEDVIKELAVNTPASEIDDYYKIHSDGGLIYNPLSRELDNADKTKYNTAKKTTGKLTLSDGSVLNYSLPTDVTAYDLIPITYTLKNGSNTTTPLYVEATTFEDKNGSYYDLCLPGNVKLDFTYQGYVSAENNGKNRPFLSSTFTKDVQGIQYPQYTASDLIASDTVPSNKPLWFKFKITNTGNTILDGDGNGTFCFQPFLENKTTGKTQEYVNRHYRLTEDLYPGESTELYVYFGSSSGMALSAGNYNIIIKCLVRNEQSNPDWGSKIWDGYQYGVANKAITVSDAPTVTTNSKAQYSVSRATPARNTWLHTYEEFTTSFDSWLKPGSINASQSNVLYVQSAAWSDRVVLKFMRGTGLNMVSATIPLKVETDSIKINLNKTADNYIVTDQGTKYPASASQSMCDMRVNTSLSPDANTDQINELLDMQECGINLVATTQAFNIETINKPTNKINNNADSIYFVSDVLRKLGMRMEGYIGYPYLDNSTLSAAYWYTHDRATTGNYTGHGDPKMQLANGLRGLYQFMRWGDNYRVNAQNKAVINVEDTRGWMRIDFNARHTTDATTIQEFQAWLTQKYTTIGKLNQAWGSNYTAFTEIDPTAGTTDDHGWNSHVSASAKLQEWSVGVNDWDIFRTLQRTNNYVGVLDTMKNYGTNHAVVNDASVDAIMSIRTEGGNVTAVVPYNTKNSHFRHVYYSGRRCALIPEILAKSGTVGVHSDYVTMPYSVSELETLTASSTALGITSMPLMQINRMRDIAINSKYGDNYAKHYNLSGNNTKGAYISTQVSPFECFKAIYENGGIPGVLWEDYLCDGYITETQKKDMKFYASKIADMMSTDEAKEWSSTNVPDVNSVLGKSIGAYSYSENYIQTKINKTKASRK